MGKYSCRLINKISEVPRLYCEKKFVDQTGGIRTIRFGIKYKTLRHDRPAAYILAVHPDIEAVVFKVRTTSRRLE